MNAIRTVIVLALIQAAALLVGLWLLGVVG